MILSHSWTTVTPLSKALALALFVLLPFGGFYLGMQYQQSQQPPVTIPTGRACTEEAKICPDGTHVSRVPPDCLFAECPTKDPETIFCAQDVQSCPDGSFVSRQPPTCAFAPCPTTPGEPTPNLFCGGIMGKACPKGMKCVLEGKYPDAGGTCI